MGYLLLLEEKRWKVVEKFPSLLAALIHWTNLDLNVGNPVKPNLYAKISSNSLHLNMP